MTIPARQSKGGGWWALVFSSAALVACGIVALLLFLFREVRIDNEHIGMVSYHYTWGRRTSVTVDSNRDGEIDFRGRLMPESDAPLEFWEDRDFDGVFEVHVLMPGDSIDLLEIDEDGDGSYETRFRGRDAEEEYRRRFAEGGSSATR